MQVKTAEAYTYLVGVFWWDWMDSGSKGPYQVFLPVVLEGAMILFHLGFRTTKEVQGNLSRTFVSCYLLERIVTLTTGVSS